MQRTSTWQWVVASVAGAHGLVSLLGAAEGLGLAEIPELDAQVGVGAGVLWLVAGLAMVATAVAVLRAPRRWWALAIPAVAVAQVAVVLSASDAWAGTIPNAVLLVAALAGVARDGPWSLRTRYDRLVAGHRLDGVVDARHRALTEGDLVDLPTPVRRYVRRSGAVGRPLVHHVEARWRGSIRSGPADPWMGFSAVQHNEIGRPARYFLMDARRQGLPVDVLHVYRQGTATMEARLLSLLRIVHAEGAEMDRAETVTVLNDMCILAPGSLVDPRIRWESIDDRTAACTFTVGTTTVRATLHFDEEDDLVDFVSDDRGMLDGGGSGMTRLGWNTRLWGHGQRGRRRTWRFGEARWHPPDGPSFPYFEGELVDLRLNDAPWLSEQPETPRGSARPTVAAGG